MAKVRLKVNMIIGGAYFPFESILDKDEVPPKFRNDQYITPVEGDEEEVEEEVIDVEEEINEEEEVPPEEKPKKKRR